jgi:hypothetical protein
MKNLVIKCRSLVGGHFVANTAKNSDKDLLDENIFFKFELEHFNPTFVRRKTIFLRIFKKLGPQIHKSPKYIGSANRNSASPQT